MAPLNGAMLPFPMMHRSFIPDGVEKRHKLLVASRHHVDLEDALSYVSQVKARCLLEPDIYRQFLDVFSNFKAQVIGPPQVVERISLLFAEFPDLIQGFQRFLPPGYGDQIPCRVRL